MCVLLARIGADAIHVAAQCLRKANIAVLEERPHATLHRIAVRLQCPRNAPEPPLILLWIAEAQLNIAPAAKARFMVSFRQGCAAADRSSPCCMPHVSPNQ